MSRRRPSLAIAAVGAMVAVLGLVGIAAPTPAWAHAYLTLTSPANGASLATPPDQVVLTFDEPISHVNVAVEGPDGLRWDDGKPATVDSEVTQRLSPLGPAGTYHVNYRVVSVDGHTVQGGITFTLTAPGPGTAPPQPTAAAAVDPASTGGTPLWPVIAVAGVVVVAAGGVIYAARRRGRRPAGDTR